MRKSDNIDLKEAIASAHYTLTSDINKDGTFQVKCDKGHIYKGRKGNFMKGHRCRICANKNRQQRIRKELSSVLEKEGYTIVSIADTVGATTEYSLICPNGHTWTSAYSNLYQGHRCPVCSDNRSYGEKVIYNALTHAGFTFEYQFRVTENNNSYHFFDFIVNRNGLTPLIIEFDGEQHFHEDMRNKKPREALNERRRRDNFKTTYAYDHKWDILRIPYTNFSASSIISFLSKKLDIAYDPYIDYSENIHNQNEIIDYYMKFGVSKTVSKYDVSQKSVSSWFKRKYNMNRNEYLTIHPEFDLKKKKIKNIAKYFLVHSLDDTILNSDASRTSISHYFKQTYGVSKNQYIREINDYVSANGLQNAISHYNISEQNINDMNKYFIKNL